MDRLLFIDRLSFVYRLFVKRGTRSIINDPFCTSMWEGGPAAGTGRRAVIRRADQEPRMRAVLRPQG